MPALASGCLPDDPLYSLAYALAVQTLWSMWWYFKQALPNLSTGMKYE